ncbi:MAG TPA: protein translocase subunit SecF [Acidimicrobiales bacterium]|nr:protein translocase subunit SecF [Acidimicrobiales bacterium]
MSLRHRLYSGNPGFDFRPAWRRALVVSVVLVAICGASLAVRGLELGIDFEGGGVWEVPTDDLSVADTRDALRPVGHEDARIQVLTDATGGRSIRVQAGVDAVDDSQDIAEALAEAAGVPVGEVAINTVGPSWGDEITSAAQRALVFFFIAIAAYIAIRLEWRMSVGALVAVVHDIIISVGIYSLFQFTVTPATIIAFLTILGYSLYDTVVVFDKLRETSRLVGVATRHTYTDMANHATNEVFMRSVNTSITSLLPVVSMLVVGSWLLGAAPLQEFAVALTVGLLVGAYSSIFVATPVVVWLKEREPANVEIRHRLAERGIGTPTPAESAEVAASSYVTAPAAPRVPGVPSKVAPTPVPPRPSGAVPPRPRKKGKRR